MSLPAPILSNGRSARARAGAALLAAAAALSGCGAPVLTPAGPVGAGDVKILADAMAIMLTIVVPTIAATLLFAWWYREGNPKAKRRPKFAYSGRIELVVWSIPLLTIMFLGGVIWVGSHDLDPYKPLKSNQKPLEVQVVSLDWKWLFIYPEEGIATVNTLSAPVGRPIHFSLTSASVMNVFFVPQLGSMIYTMNGMADQLSLQADKPGVYAGRAAMINGDGFPDMHFDVHALPPAQYAAWLSTAKASGPVLDRANYALLARQSGNVRPLVYRAFQPGLFDDIVAQRIGPAAGPAEKVNSDTHVFPKPLDPK